MWSQTITPTSRQLTVRKLGYSREAAIAAGRMAMQLCDVLPLDGGDVEQSFPAQ